MSSAKIHFDPHQSRPKPLHKFNHLNGNGSETLLLQL